MNSLPFFVKYLCVTCFLMNTLFMSAYIEDAIMSTETNKKYLKTKGNFSVSFREVWHWETTATDVDWAVKKQQQLKTTFSEQFSSAPSTSSCSAWHCLAVCCGCCGLWRQQSIKCVYCNLMELVRDFAHGLVTY